jgi:hypothetical protein
VKRKAGAHFSYSGHRQPPPFEVKPRTIFPHTWVA